MSSEFKITRRQFLVNGVGAGVGGLLLAQKLDPEMFASRVNPKERLSVAIIGMGQRGTNQLAQSMALPDVEILALCDWDEQVLRRSALGVRVGDRRTPELVTDYRSILERSDIDVVSVATPLSCRSQIVRSACEANKHVYVEPPWAGSAEESRELLAYIKMHEKRVRQGPFNPAWNTDAIAQLIREPGLPLQAIHMTIYQSSSGNDARHGLQSAIDQFHLAGHLLQAANPAGAFATRGLTVSGGRLNAFTSHLSFVSEDLKHREVVVQVFTMPTWSAGQMVIELNAIRSGQTKEYEIKTMEEQLGEIGPGEPASAWTEFLDYVRYDHQEELSEHLRQAHCANSCYFLTEASLQSGQAVRLEYPNQEDYSYLQLSVT